MKTPEGYDLAIVPGSDLDQVVNQLGRRNRRLLLAAFTGANTRRRARLQRRLVRRVGA